MLQDRKLDQRRLRELANFFQPYEAAARRGGGSGGARAAHRGGTRITIRLPSRGGLACAAVSMSFGSAISVGGPSGCPQEGWVGGPIQQDLPRFPTGGLGGLGVEGWMAQPTQLNEGVWIER